MNVGASTWRVPVGSASITANLYAAGKEKRLLQELVLGVGGWRLVEKLKLDVQVCHLNEGHAAFAVLARAASFARDQGVSFDVALRTTRAGNVFTTHTPVEAAFDQFEPALLARYAQPFLESSGVPLERVLAMGRKNPSEDHELFNMAYLAMRNSCHVNGVARLHGQVSRRLFRVLFPDWPVEEVRDMLVRTSAVAWNASCASGANRRSGYCRRGTCSIRIT